MGYDIDFVQVTRGKKESMPASGKQAGELLAKALPFEDAEATRTKLLEVPGCRPGPGDSIDFLGRGLNYARLSVHDKAIHVENNCGAGELLRIYKHLCGDYPALLIHDLQSGQLHDAASFEQWWSRPL